MLQPVKKINLPEWAKQKDVKNLMKIIDVNKSRFVGGCVRNHLINKEVKDIDIATIYTPNDILELLKKANIKAIPTGIEHGTITAIINDKKYEITTLRKDIDTNGRHAIVSFTNSWEEDALRRDFTINTLLMDMKGNIYDPTGRGLADLQSGKVIFVGNPEIRIKEDYLRILRYFRFHAAYGKGDMDKDSLKACIKFSAKLSLLSKERITDELLKILSLNRFVGALRIIKENNILPNIFKKLIHFSALEKMSEVQKNMRDDRAWLKILILADCNKSYLSEIIENLCLSKRKNIHLYEVLDVIYSLDFDSIKSVKVQIYKKKSNIVLDALILAYSYDYIDKQNFLNLYEFAKKWKAPILPVNGKDLLEIGIPQGREIGKALQKIEGWWIENDFKPNKEQSINYISQFL